MSGNALQSWNETSTKRTILEFVGRVADPSSPSFVPSAERVAVVDNDGTLWCERPAPVQAEFLMARLRQLAQATPSLRDQQPYRAALEHDYPWLVHAIERHYNGDDDELKKASAALLGAYAGVTLEQYEQYARQFVQRAQHPLLHRSYLRCGYAPMIELLDYLRGNDFTTYLVSGGSRDFVRTFAEELYGIPPERVIGSTSELVFQQRGDHATIVHGSRLGVFDDGDAKPVQIWSTVGRRPLLAVGNANGDIAMLRFCAHVSRPSLALLLDHDDERREFNYRAGAEEALRSARALGWTVISLKEDWKQVFI
jgi:phosphoglycolate phosphatase-like HAD superfamily hydrolase